uniref:Cytochrome c oxidase subunit 3 n=1 Tax=Blastocladiella sp. TaxID=2169676 RepID=A0A890JLF4_9FUNG|nr:cytochrome c oxidase subunit 3 [Blastocladiella sp.]
MTNATSIKNLSNIQAKSFQVHPYHLVEPSPWPLGAAVACLILTLGAAMKFHGYLAGDIALPLGLLLVLSTMALWWRDVVRESTYQGYHTNAVKYGITLGVILFIISEIMLFFSIFWAFFHSSLAPSVELGSTWPPVGIEPLNPFEVPLLNTIILLTSGCTVTVSHAKIISGDRRATILYLILTILLAWSFLGLQGVEYVNAPFTIADSVYGSTFYLSTGFHGLHVLIGTIFLTVCLNRIMSYHLTAQHHLGFEYAIWYWHVVDVIWLFLFISVYYWGNSV